MVHGSFLIFKGRPETQTPELDCARMQVICKTLTVHVYQDPIIQWAGMRLCRHTDRKLRAPGSWMDWEEKTQFEPSRIR